MNVLKVVLKSVDEKKLVGDVLAELLEPALKKFVADSANPYDDMLVNLAYPKLKEFILEELEKAVVKAEA
jgi:hypothetical protein